MPSSRRTFSLFTASLLVAASLAFAACGDDSKADDNNTAGSGGSSTAGSGGTDSAGSGGTDSAGSGGTEGNTAGSGGTGGDAAGSGGAGGDVVGSGGTSGTGGASAVTATVLVQLDPAKAELPEGLTIDGDTAYVGYAFTGAIEKVNLKTGERSAIAKTPPPPPNTSFLTGVGLDANKQIYGAFVSFTADAAAGVYRAPAAGGDATLFASDPQMVFPNGFAWDDKGSLYVTDSAYGGVFKIASDGAVSPWIKSDLLAGNPPACGQPADALVVGANGVVWTKDALLISSSDQGLVVKVPVQADGSAGTPEVLAGPDCDKLAGIDGIVMDEDGSLVGAVNRANRIVRIGKDGVVSVLFEGAPLDFPASLAFAGAGADRALYVTSFALSSYASGGSPKPALVKLSLP